MSDSAPNSEVETINIHGLFEESARIGLDLQHDDGSFPATRTGVDGEQRTAVRATAGWLSTLVEAFNITGNDEFSDAAHDAADYLISKEARPHGYTFHIRNSKSKDMCDGLVGQAGPIGALSRAGQVLERPRLREEAYNVFILHPFNEQLGIWERREITGDLLSYDRTLNHQIIFAANLTKLSDFNEVDRRLQHFLDKLQDRLHVRREGIIIHYSKFKIHDIIKEMMSGFRHYPLLKNELVYYIYLFSNKRKFKEIGYHPNNMYHLTKLYQYDPSHSFWSTEEFDKIKNFMFKDIDNCLSFCSAHGSSVPGFTYALPIYEFHPNSDEVLNNIIKNELSFTGNELMLEKQHGPAIHRLSEIGKYV